VKALFLRLLEQLLCISTAVEYFNSKCLPDLIQLDQPVVPMALAMAFTERSKLCRSTSACA